MVDASLPRSSFHTKAWVLALAANAVRVVFLERTGSLHSFAGKVLITVVFPSVILSNKNGVPLKQWPVTIST